MDLDLEEDYDDRVQEIKDEFEESGREAGLNSSPSREVKEELIEKEEMLMGSRKTGDGKVSSESIEETERIIIDDSNKESFTIREVTQEEGEEQEPYGEVPTPVLESTPYKGHGKGGGKVSA